MRVIFFTHVGQRFQVADADGGDHVDAGRQQGLHVLPPVGVSRARQVAVGQLIDQSNLGPAGQHRGQIQLRSHRAQVGEWGAGNDLQTGQQGLGVRPAVRLGLGHHHVRTAPGALLALAQQRAGRARTWRVAEVDPQPPAGGRFLLSGVSAH
jgi:hypothetical protein